MLEEVVSVDAAGADIEPRSKNESHMGRGILHRAFSVILLDDQGQVCLQRRSEKKRLWPLHWSNSCCSHPGWEEPRLRAVRRRIREELGCEATGLHEVCDFRYFAKYRDIGVELEHCHVWLGNIRSEDVDPNPEEVDAIAFLSARLVGRSLRTDPRMFTPWFHIEWLMVQGLLPRSARTGHINLLSDGSIQT